MIDIKKRPITKDNIYVSKPRKFAVILENDDTIHYRIVENLLMNIFHRSKGEAATVARAIHENGKGELGIYSKEIAETKVHRSRRWGVKEKVSLPIYATAV